MSTGSELFSTTSISVQYPTKGNPSKRKGLFAWENKTP